MSPKPHERRWETVSALGQKFSPRTGHTVVEHQGSIYVFGGTDQHKRQHDLYRYLIDSNTWEKLHTKGQLPCRRSGAVGCVHGGKMYLFGGYDGRDGNYYNDLFSYDFAKNEWTELVPTRHRHQMFLDRPNQGRNLLEFRVPPPRTDHVLVYYNNSLYVFGGYDGQTRFQDIFAFDLQTGTWRVEAEAEPFKPSRRFGHSGVVYQNSFYMFGGWDGRETLDCLWQYDFVQKKWSNVDSAPSPKSKRLKRLQKVRPRHRYRHSAVVHGDSMFVFGGVDKEHRRFNDLQRFDFETLEWEEVKTNGIIPSSRTFHRAVTSGKHMFLLGGYDGKRRLNDMCKIFVGCLSPPSLVDMCAGLIRCNLSSICETPGAGEYIAHHFSDLIWKRDPHGNLRSGIYEGPNVVCRGYEPTTHNPASMVCAACGELAPHHVLVDEKELIANHGHRWQPDYEEIDDQNDNSQSNNTKPSSSSSPHHTLKVDCSRKAFAAMDAPTSARSTRKRKVDEHDSLSDHDHIRSPSKSLATREVLERITNIRFADESKH